MKRKFFSVFLAALLIFGLASPAAFAAEGNTEPASAFSTDPMVTTFHASGIGSHTTALHSDGTVWAWGNNAYGQLGNGTARPAYSNIPVQVPGLTGIVGIAPWAAVRNDGTVWEWFPNWTRHTDSWGDYYWTPNPSSISQVPGVSNVTAIASFGPAHGMQEITALRSDGTVLWWMPSDDDRWAVPPTQVPNLSNVTAIAAGTALRSDGTVWSLNVTRDDATDRLVVGPPIQIPDLSNITAISGNLALRNDGTVWLMEMGWDWETNTPVPQPSVRIPNVNDATAISEQLVLRSGGTVWYVVWEWGAQPSMLEQVPNLNNVAAISGFSLDGRAIRNDGTVWAWGWNQDGQLGNGVGGGGWTADCVVVTTPVQVRGPGNVGFLNLGTGEQPPPPPPPVGNFTDVREGDWFLDAVRFVYEGGIMRGTTDTTFEPTANFSRAMVVTTLFRMHHDRVANAGDSTSNPFTDVASGAWYAPYVTWANNNNIVGGVGDNRFAPDDPVTREQLATMFHRYVYNMTDRDTTPRLGAQWNNFTDRNQTSAWAANALMWANYHGIITGRTATTIAPTGTANRAEAATMLMRLIQWLPNAPEAPPAMPPNFPQTLPDRRLTDAERDVWIVAYWAGGGPTAAELETIVRLNEVRAEHGLSTVQMCNALMMAARFYCQTMGQWGRLGHNVGPYATDPNAAHGASANIARAFGGTLRWNGGNGASGAGGADVIDRWMNSPGHRAYILSPEHRTVGIGFAEGFGYLFLGPGQ